MFVSKSQKVVFLLTIMMLSILNISSAQAALYKNPALGISFSHPDSVKLDMSNANKDPYKIPFTYGEPPFSISVMLKDTGVTGELSNFLKREHSEQKKGGYAGQIQEINHTLASGQQAVELIRKTKYGTISYFVFPTPKTNKIMALWLMSSSTAGPEGHTIAAYKAMRDSLSLSK
jgi:hypothetical protein